MTCIILAAGYATRLLPITHSFPKPLLPVRGRTVLDLLVDNIGLSERIDRFVVVTNHRNIEYFNFWNRKRKEIISVIDDMTETNDTRLGFVGDLDLAISTLPNEEDLLVVSGSVLFDLNLGEFIEMALKKNATCILCRLEDPVESQTDRGIRKICADESENISFVTDKPDCSCKAMKCIPVCFLKADAARLIRQSVTEGCGTDDPEDLITRLFRKTDIYSLDMTGGVFCINDHQSYERAKKEFTGIKKR